MSFLNSVLSSIGGNGAPISTPPPAAARPQNADSAQNVVLPARTNTPQNNKRKAEDELVRPIDKAMKNGVSGLQSWRATPPTESRTTFPANSSSTFSSKSAMSFRGTSRPNTAAVAPAAPTQLAPESAKAPKKGSYAEIMARAKATQSKAPVVGVISHKPKEQMAVSYKKELKMRKKAIKNKKLGIQDGDRPSSSGSMSSSPAPGVSDRKKVPQPTYKGTAKPRPQPTYKGTMKPNASATQRPSSRPGGDARPRYDEYAATDEDDLDDVEEDDYASDESDDMEAGFSDVEQEETAAARAARKEDEEEAKLEAKLKSEKEERKKRLAEMAKKAKPQRY